ncbi:MAG: hypothetical protein LBG92_03200 [Prevotellaceae bacterium]|jgi:hypothetical protein|nr:hypothetical protein [Prevotellaceae bacterium]
MQIGSKNIPAGKNFHNRRRAIALPAAKNDSNQLSERQNSIAKELKFCLTSKDENDCATANRALLVCGYENLAHSG